MPYRKPFTGTLLIILAFIMIIAGCKSDADDGLEGTWVCDPEELKFDDGSFEISEYGVTHTEGTYTTDNGKITMTPARILDYGDGLMYSENQMLEFPGADEEEIKGMFAGMTGTYSISGDTLTLTLNGEPEIWTRKKQ